MPARGYRDLSKIILPTQFTTMPWKNGGGVTHEIAREQREGSILWRLSIAEVASDGPFSLFPGLTRLLTVIEGKGMQLEASSRVIEAMPLRPVRFSGDEPIFGRLADGPVRDLNLIFDGARIDGAVESLDARDGERSLGQIHGAVLSIAGPVTVDGRALPPGAVALGKVDNVCLSESAIVVAVTIREK